MLTPIQVIERSRKRYWSKIPFMLSSNFWFWFPYLLLDSGTPGKSSFWIFTKSFLGILVADHVGYCRYEKLSWLSTTTFWSSVRRKPTLDRFLRSLLSYSSCCFNYMLACFSLMAIILFLYVACELSIWLHCFSNICF